MAKRNESASLRPAILVAALTAFCLLYSYVAYYYPGLLG